MLSYVNITELLSVWSNEFIIQSIKPLKTGQAGHVLVNAHDTYRNNSMLFHWKNSMRRIFQNILINLENDYHYIKSKRKSDDLLYVNTEDVRQEVADDTIASEQTWVNTEWLLESTHAHTHIHKHTSFHTAAFGWMTGIADYFRSTQRKLFKMELVSLKVNSQGMFFFFFLFT